MANIFIYSMFFWHYLNEWVRVWSWLMFNFNIDSIVFFHLTYLKIELYKITIFLAKLNPFSKRRSNYVQFLTRIKLLCCIILVSRMNFWLRRNFTRCRRTHSVDIDLSRRSFVSLMISINWSRFPSIYHNNRGLVECDIFNDPSIGFGTQLRRLHRTNHARFFGLIAWLGLFISISDI